MTAEREARDAEQRAKLNRLLSGRPRKSIDLDGVSPPHLVENDTVCPSLSAVEVARALVARWEHGDEAHRQWLRDIAVPDIARALSAVGGQSVPDQNASETLWQAIRMIGARDDEKKDFLIEMLNGESGGCRSAAANALGEMGELDALRDRLPVETNKFVIAGITAHLRSDTKP